MKTLEQEILRELREQRQLLKALAKRFDVSTEWMTKKEVMDLTGWSERNLYKHSQSGQFTKRVSGGLKFKRSDINEYLEKITVKKAA
jgi:predicted DNA-binding transcriptional regulator AlpA